MICEFAEFIPGFDIVLTDTCSLACHILDVTIMSFRGWDSCRRSKAAMKLSVEFDSKERETFVWLALVGLFYVSVTTGFSNLKVQLSWLV